MTKCTKNINHFSPVKSRIIDTSFDGGNITSDAGILLLKKADKYHDLSSKINKRVNDPRHKAFIEHSQRSMVQQYLFALSLGYEDLNDHNFLRDDILFQAGSNSCEELASSFTLGRMQRRITFQENIDMCKLLVDLWISKQKTVPKNITLDFDSTDALLHGEQEAKHYHGYYHGHCYMPLYVFIDRFPVCALLQPSNMHGSHYSKKVLIYLVRRIRETFPKTKILFRADGGFCKPKIMRWCESNKVDYIIGFSSNKKLSRLTSDFCDDVKITYFLKEKKQKKYTELNYCAGSWESIERRVLVKCEHTFQGENVRYVVTSLKQTPKHLYEKIYCARGDMENRIKEQQLDLFSDRMSANKFQANWFRTLMSCFAYVLIDTIREVGLKGHALSKSYCGTIRLKLLKIGAVVSRNTRRIKVQMSSNFPLQNLFWKVAENLSPP